MTLTGRFAFVEFRMPEYATAALQLNGQIALMGNTLKIARPSSYVEPSQVCAALLLMDGVCLNCSVRRVQRHLSVDLQTKGRIVLSRVDNR